MYFRRATSLSSGNVLKLLSGLLARLAGQLLPCWRSGRNSRQVRVIGGLVAAVDHGPAEGEPADQTQDRGERLGESAERAAEGKELEDFADDQAGNRNAQVVALLAVGEGAGL